MESQSLSQIIRRKRQTVLIIFIFCFSAAFLLSIIEPMRFKAETKVLVRQGFASNIDPYTASKSNEYLSAILARIIGSNSFYGEVVNAGFNLDKSYYPSDIFEQKREWNRAVKAKIVNDTGIISISVYHRDREQADLTAQAINFVLRTKHGNYHGLGDRVSVIVIDQPYVGSHPDLTYIAVNLLGAIFLSFFLSFIYIYLFPEEKYDLRFWPRRRQSVQAHIADPKSSQPVYESKQVHSAYVSTPSYQQTAPSVNVRPEATPTQPNNYAARHRDVSDLLK